MKRLLTILILIFTLQTPSWADDIRDFQIEGMSIGDSLLKYMSKKQIEHELNNTDITVFYPDNKFAGISLFVIKNSFEIYDDVGVIIKPNDKNFKIFGLEGTLFFGQNIKKCYEKQNEIFNEFKEIFGNKYKVNSWDSKNPNKYLKIVKYKDFNSDTNEQARVICYDNREGFERKVDALYVVLNSSEFVVFQRQN